jgi:hypothetical protein
VNNDSSNNLLQGWHASLIRVLNRTRYGNDKKTRTTSGPKDEDDVTGRSVPVPLSSSGVPVPLSSSEELISMVENH